MPRSRMLAFIAPTLVLVPLLLAQAPAAPTTNSPPSGIVTLNFNSVVLGTAEAQRDLAALQKKYSPREQHLHKLNDDLDASRKSMSDEAAKFSEAERNQRVQDMNAKDKQLQREAEDFKNDSQADSQQVFQRVAQKVYAFLQEYAQKHGYSAVIERGTDTAPIVWYAANNIDVTDALIKAYNVQFGAEPTMLPDKPAASHSQGAGPRKP